MPRNRILLFLLAGAAVGFGFAMAVAESRESHRPQSQILRQIDDLVATFQSPPDIQVEVHHTAPRSPWRAWPLAVGGGVVLALVTFRVGSGQQRSRNSRS
jgi:hypothetical protein